MLFIMWSWACEQPVGSAGPYIGLPRDTIVQMYRYIRDICSWKLLQDDIHKLGEPGHVVQIDESVFTRRKYNVGRVVDCKWVIGIYDVQDKRGYLQLIEHRDAKTLLDVITEHVLPGTEIWTDCWKGYSSLNCLEGVSPYTHKTVNHSRNFIDPVTGVCTNHVEGLWGCVKNYMRKLSVRNSPYIAEYLDQYMWRREFGQTAKDRFTNIVNHITEKYN